MGTLRTHLLSKDLGNFASSIPVTALLALAITNVQAALADPRQ